MGARLKGHAPDSVLSREADGAERGAHGLELADGLLHREELAFEDDAPVLELEVDRLDPVLLEGDLPVDGVFFGGEDAVDGVDVPVGELLELDDDAQLGELGRGVGVGDDDAVDVGGPAVGVDGAAGEEVGDGLGVLVERLAEAVAIELEGAALADGDADIAERVEGVLEAFVEAEDFVVELGAEGDGGAVAQERAACAGVLVVAGLEVDAIDDVVEGADERFDVALDLLVVACDGELDGVGARGVEIDGDAGEDVVERVGVALEQDALGGVGGSEEDDGVVALAEDVEPEVEAVGVEGESSRGAGAFADEAEAVCGAAVAGVEDRDADARFRGVDGFDDVLEGVGGVEGEVDLEGAIDPVEPGVGGLGLAGDAEVSGDGALGVGDNDGDGAAVAVVGLGDEQSVAGAVDGGDDARAGGVGPVVDLVDDVAEGSGVVSDVNLEDGAVGVGELDLARADARAVVEGAEECGFGDVAELERARVHLALCDTSSARVQAQVRGGGVGAGHDQVEPAP